MAALLAAGTARAEIIGPPAPSATICGADHPVARGPRLGPRLAGYGLLAAADLGSTEMFLHRGLEEANGLMRNRGVRITSRSAAAVGFAMLDQHLDRKGHRKAMWVVRGALTIGTGIAVGLNLRAYSATGPAAHR